MYGRVSKERVLFVGISLVFLAISLFEPIYALIRMPEGARYTLAHNYPEDYFYYLHIMRQGYDGFWNVTSRMTPESFAGQFTVPFFMLLGKVGQILPISPEMLYLIARASGAAALLAMIWMLVRTLFHDTNKRLWAYLLTVTGAFVPIIHDGRLDAPALVRSWSELDPLIRLAFIPHHLWSKVMAVLLMFLFAKHRSLHRGNPWFWRMLPLFVGVATVLMGFTSPVILVTYGLTVSLWIAGEYLIARRHQMSEWHGDFVLYTSSCLALIAVMLYHWNLSHSTFPWTTYGPPWENNWLVLYSPIEYIGTFGILFVFALIGMVVSFPKDALARMLTYWVASGWLLSYVFRKLLPFSGSRYLSGYQWIAVGILSVYGLSYVMRLFPQRIRARGFAVFAGILVLLSFPSWFVSMRSTVERIEKVRYDPQFFTNRQIWDTLGYLDSVSVHPCTVAAPDWLDTMIPAYTSCRSVSGHRLMSWANDIKVYEMNEFFFSPVPIGKKAERIRQYHITHVVTMTGITGTDILQLLAPEPVFESGGVRVYRTR